jgi:circadian clock protein KaiB
MDVYSSGGDVVMGTLRWEREAEERARKLQQQAEYGHKRRQLLFTEADIAARITALQLDLERQRAELARCTLDDEARHVSAGEWQNKVRKMRSADTVVAAPPAPGKRRAARISAKARTNDNREPQHGRKRTKTPAARETITTVVMRLYDAGKAPNSVKAIANLEAICRRYLKDSYKLEIVDVCEHPQRALADGVFVTPSLAKLWPAPTSNVIGNLSDTDNLLAALGLPATDLQ